MIKCEMCGDLVHDTIHGVCYTCAEEEISEAFYSELCECVTNQCSVH